jgi:hypothetical protein
VNALVPIPTSNADVYRASTDAAGLCREIVLKTAMEIQGRKYVKVEGWQAIAIAHGCTGSARDVEAVEGGVRAIGEIRRMSDGSVIAEAEGFVGEDEPTWYGGEVTTKWGKKTLPKRPDYAIRAMAQTRAISRACRSAFAHVVVLIDANLSTTPAEEVPADGFADREPPRQEQKPTQAPPAARVDWRTLDDEMDACRSVEELEAWNQRREREIKALPKPKFDQLAAKFGDLRGSLPEKAPAAKPAAADDFGIGADEIHF